MAYTMYGLLLCDAVSLVIVSHAKLSTAAGKLQAFFMAVKQQIAFLATMQYYVGHSYCNCNLFQTTFLCMQTNFTSCEHILKYLMNH